MVAESLNIDNQFTVNASSVPRTKKTKMVHKKKQICCNKNSQSLLHTVSPPIITNKFFLQYFIRI